MNFLSRICFFAIILARIRSGTSNNLLLPQPQIVTSNETTLTTKKFNNESQLLRVATLHYVPFMYQDNNGSFYDGIEYKLMKMIAKMLNMNLSFQTGHLDICSNVVLNISDICIGGIFPKENALEHTDISVTYASDDLTWCVQRAGIMPLYLSQLFVLKPETWFLIIFVYGYPSGLILYFLIQFDKQYDQRNNRDWHYTTWLVALPACIGVPSAFNPKGGIVRSFYGFMLVAAFMFFQIVFVYFFDFIFLRVPWYQISTFEEIIEKKLRLAGSVEAYNVLNRSEKISTEFFNICGHINECVERLLLDDKLAVAVSRKNILNSLSYSPETVFCFNSESITSYPIAMYMQKGFYLKQRVNDIIRKLIESGYFEKWDISRADDYKLPVYSVVPFNLEHGIALLIFVLGTGSLMSLATFFVEKYVFWKTQQRDKHKIWIYLEQFFDGHRHYFKNVPERLQEQNKNNFSETIYPYLE